MNYEMKLQWFGIIAKLPNMGTCTHMSRPFRAAVLSCLLPGAMPRAGISPPLGANTLENTLRLHASAGDISLDPRPLKTWRNK